MGFGLLFIVDNELMLGPVEALEVVVGLVDDAFSLAIRTALPI